MAGMEGRRKTWSKVADLPRAAWTLEVSWDENILDNIDNILDNYIRLSQGMSTLKRRGNWEDSRGIGKMCDNLKPRHQIHRRPLSQVLSSIISMKCMHVAIIPPPHCLGWKRLIPSQTLWHKIKALVIFVLLFFFFNCVEKEAGFKYLHGLLGNKLYVIFIKTMNSHRIYIVFELGAKGSWPQLNGWFVGRNSREALYCALCPAPPALRARQSCQKLRARRKPWLLQCIKCVRWDLTLDVIVELRPPLWTHNVVLLNVTDGYRSVCFSGRKSAAQPTLSLQKWCLRVCGEGAIKQIVILSLSAERRFKTDTPSVQPCRKGRAYLSLQLHKDCGNQLRNHEISQISNHCLLCSFSHF